MNEIQPIDLAELSIPEELERPFVDWLSFTLEHTEESWEFLEVVFGRLEKQEKGYSGYTHTFRTLGDVFGAFSPERRSQKIYVSLSSKALFNLDPNRTNLSGLIQGVIKQGGKFKRIDLALDDYRGKLNLWLMYEKLKRKEVASRFRGFTRFEEHTTVLDSNSLFTDPKIGKSGFTLFIGAFRGSKTFARAYDKKLQVGEECSWPIWNRLEFQLMHEAADQYCNPTWNVDPDTGEILDKNARFPDPRRAVFENRSFPRTAYYYLKFLEPKYKQKQNDLGHFFIEPTHKQHWYPSSWWVDFLKVSKGEGIGLPKNETGLQDIDNWLRNQVSGAVYLMSDIYGEQYFSKLKMEGKEKFERNQKYQNLKDQFLEKKRQETEEGEDIDEIGW